jgi:hypothetical protein
MKKTIYTLIFLSICAHLLAQNKMVVSETPTLILSYNNPIHQNLVLNLQKEIPTTQLTIQIHDMHGKWIRSHIVDVKEYRAELNLTSLAAGMYVVTCRDEQNKIKEMLKILKK